MKKTTKIISFVLCVLIMSATLCISCFAEKNDKILNARSGVVKVVQTVTLTIGSDKYSGTWVGSALLLATDSLTESDCALTAYHVVDDKFYAYNYFDPDSDVYDLFAQYDGLTYENVPYFSMEMYVLLENDIRVSFKIDKNAFSAANDWALIHLEKKLYDINAFVLGDSDTIEVGEDVWALGFPLNTEHAGQTYTFESVIVTQGTVNQTNQKFLDTEFIVHTALITGGNSGGPLVDRNGIVIGINARESIDAELGSKTGYGYAVKINQVRTVLDRFGIEYKSADGGSETSPLLYIIVGAAVIAAGVIVLVTLLVNNKKKKDAAIAAPAPQKQAMLCCIGGVMNGRVIPLTDRIYIGRDGSRCSIVYPENAPGVSRLHCEIAVREGSVYLTDLNSSYGTFTANGVRLTPGQPLILLNGTRFYLGAPENMFTIQY